jgi:hypothetical protein
MKRKLRAQSKIMKKWLVRTPNRNETFLKYKIMFSIFKVKRSQNSYERYGLLNEICSESLKNNSAKLFTSKITFLSIRSPSFFNISIFRGRNQDFLA